MVAETRKTERVQQYAKRWDKDSSKDTDAHKQSRLDEYTEVVNGESCSWLWYTWKSCARQAASSRGHAADITGYYDGATELYEFGWAESFHFSRFFKGEGLLQSVRTLPQSFNPH